MTDAPLPLPKEEDAGCQGTWVVADHSGKPWTIDGTFLGMGTTHRPFHKHDRGVFAALTQHCSSCRWSEISVFRQASEGQYVILNRGVSIVPGETTRTSIAEVAPDDMDVLMKLLGSLGYGSMLFTKSSVQMLARAAENDGELHAALTGRSR